MDNLVAYTSLFFLLIQVAWAALGIARTLVASLPLSERLGSIEGEEQFLTVLADQELFCNGHPKELVR